MTRFGVMKHRRIFENAGLVVTRRPESPPVARRGWGGAAAS